MVEVPKKDSKCHWSDSEQKIMLLICREYHKKNGVDTHFNWAEIAEKFVEKTGKKVTPKECKNKFDYMKSVWRAWSDLQYKETGCGWNENTRTIEASDEWWAKKIKKNDKYKRFRRKVVDLELTELWESVYNSICATGQHCVSVNMDPTCSTPVDASRGDNDDINAYLLSEEDVDLEGFTESIAPPVTQETFVGGTKPSPSLGKRSTTTGISQPFPKRKKKRSSMAAQYKEHMVSMENTSEKILSLLQGELGSTGSTGKGKIYEVEDAYAVIDRLVQEGVIMRVSPLWCYAVDELNNDHSRRLFMTLKTDQEKMAWLEYKFNKQAWFLEYHFVPL